MNEHYWKVTNKVSQLFFLIGLVGLGFLLSMFEFTNKIWSGYIVVGIMLWLCYKWEYFEK